MSTSSSAGSPARTSPTPADEPGSAVNGPGSGLSSMASFAYYDPAGCCWRTWQRSLVEGLDEFSETWPRSGTTQSGTAYQREPSAPLIRETDGSVWPTPKVAATRNSRKALTQKHFSGLALAQAVEVASGVLPREFESWDEMPPMAKRLWPTPTSRDHRGGQAGRVGDPARHGGWNLNDWATVDPGSGQLRGGIGHLNPTWVEWLMGFPAGWTDLGDSATPSSPKSPSTSAG
jgi:hypothetical protein